MVAIKKFAGPVLGAAAKADAWDGEWSHDYHYSNGLGVSQYSTDSDNLLRHTGIDGPYHYLKEVVSADVPEGCQVNQVHLLSRHAERFPDIDEYNRFENLLCKIRENNPHGPLEFIRDYELFMDEGDAGKLTYDGPFSGRDEARRFGQEFYEKYGHLVDGDSAWNKKYHHDSYNRDNVRVFSSSLGRVQETAHEFIKGFFHNYDHDEDCDWSDHHNDRVIVLDEDCSNGANSLTPHKSCDPYKERVKKAIFEDREFWYGDAGHEILDRVNQFVDGCLDLDDVHNLFSLCSYELNAKGRSEFCDIFSKHEWCVYEYDQDVVNYYARGPGNEYSRAVGSTFARALLKLLHEDSSYYHNGYDGHHYNDYDHDGHHSYDYDHDDYYDGKYVATNTNMTADYNSTVTLSSFGRDHWSNKNLFFSFTHHDDVTALFTALGFWNPRQPLPKDYRPDHGSPWVAADISPMKQHLTIERLECHDNHYCNTSDCDCDCDSSSDNCDCSWNDGQFVRVLLNDAVLPIPECRNGPGHSCALDRFTKLVESRLVDYCSTCEIDSDIPTETTFFWDRY
ncbi:hypothetical protein TRICI_001774 [Trichomonascus ciferrii]|uniref:Acid phosphatase n=1 Tax=Trichomonascus ciferrii TaxID=44093 RepID=A0A642V8L1_9ASCO|nr:hypothetical protein TRICI_001774 [Trichomonascus ciferrii]